MTLAQLRASLFLWRRRYAWRNRRFKYWQHKRNQRYTHKWSTLREEAKQKIHRRIAQIKEIEARRPVTMYDAVEVNNIPSNPKAVAGYVNGRYVNYPELVRRFPHAKHLSIAVSASANADCLDIEAGDATPYQAPAWVRRQHARGLRRPVLYASASAMPTIKALVARSGVRRDEVRYWVAQWTNRPHIPAGYDACQYSGGMILDISLTRGDFWT